MLARDAVTDVPQVGQVIAATPVMERSRLATPLLPTSLFSAFDEDKKRLASVTLRRAVQRPIRDALLPSATMADRPPAANPRRVEDLPAFRRLAEQLDRIGGRRDALERYDRFRRNSGFDELNALAGSVYGAVPEPPMAATDGYITRIAAGADLPNLDALAAALPAKPPEAPSVEAAKPSEPKPGEPKPVIPAPEPVKPVAAVPPPPPAPLPVITEVSALVAQLPVPPKMPAEAPPMPEGEAAPRP